MTLTPAGAGALQRLTPAGLDRFALFVADWQPGDARMLTASLDKLRNSIVPSLRSSSSCGRPADAGQALPDGISQAD